MKSKVWDLEMSKNLSFKTRKIGSVFVRRGRLRENIAPFNTDKKKKAYKNRFGDFWNSKVDPEGD